MSRSRFASASFRFQFHSGSIRRKTRTRCITWWRPCFNSTLVRLEAALWWEEIAGRLVFQFHSGSIRRIDEIFQRGNQAVLFQFHSGSIRSSTRRRATRSRRGFNSTLVRLEALNRRALRLGKFCFNSTLVRLEAQPRRRTSRRSGEVSIPLWFD